MGVGRYKNSFRKYDHLYDNIGGLDDPCVYCGMPATGWDHIPPLHYVERIREVDIDHGGLKKYPCCMECNTIIGGEIITTLAERRAIVRKKLRRRYRTYADMPEWDEEEIDELSSDDARRYIRQHARFSKMIKMRLGWKR